MWISKNLTFAGLFAAALSLGSAVALAQDNYDDNYDNRYDRDFRPASEGKD